MNTTLCLLLLAANPGLSTGAADATDRVELQDRAMRTFELSLPTEAWRLLSGAIPVAHSGGAGFAVEPAGVGLKIDTDGDGVLERLVEGTVDEATGVRAAWVRLAATHTSGRAFEYAVRLKDEGKGWHWAPSSVVQGKLEKQKVQVIDLSGNGRFDDYGEDAFLAGSGKIAALLSRALLVDGELRSLSVAADGSSLQLGDYEGETGLLDVTSGLETDGKLLSAVFVHADDPTLSFDLALAGGAAALPVGRYRIVSGALGLSKARVFVRPGRAKTVEVTSATPASVAWGGPVKAEFAFARRGAEVTFDPRAVWYFGASGEEYFGWTPRGKSPEFTIKERKLGTELSKAVFPGST